MDYIPFVYCSRNQLKLVPYFNLAYTIHGLTIVFANEFIGMEYMPLYQAD